MKIDDFRGELTGISAKKEALKLTCHKDRDAKIFHSLIQCSDTTRKVGCELHPCAGDH